MRGYMGNNDVGVLNKMQKSLERGGVLTARPRAQDDGFVERPGSSWSGLDRGVFIYRPMNRTGGGETIKDEIYFGIIYDLLLHG